MRSLTADGGAGVAVVLVLVVTGGAMNAATPDDFLDSEITAEMVARSTVDLDPAASTVDVEQTVEKSDQRTVRLTSDLVREGQGDQSINRRVEISYLFAG